MRIAISGTHCSGKSSLITAFLDKYPNYSHEVEAYEALEQLGESFSSETNAEDLFRQLQYCVERLHHSQSQDYVVFERSPLDYVGYLQALIKLNRVTASVSLAQRAIEISKQAVTHLDAIAYLPLQGRYRDVSEEEDLELRDAVDSRLEAILINDELNILNGERPLIVELTGSTRQRLLALSSTKGFQGV